MRQPFPDNPHRPLAKYPMAKTFKRSQKVCSERERKRSFFNGRTGQILVFLNGRLYERRLKGVNCSKYHMLIPSAWAVVFPIKASDYTAAWSVRAVPTRACSLNDCGLNSGSHL